MANITQEGIIQQFDNQAQEDKSFGRFAYRQIIAADEEDNEDLIFGIVNAYNKLRDELDGLENKRKFKIIMKAINMQTEALRNYQRDQQEFRESLEEEYSRD